jgi:hypothetical protein
MGWPAKGVGRLMAARLSLAGDFCRDTACPFYSANNPFLSLILRVVNDAHCLEPVLTISKGGSCNPMADGM